MVFDGDILKFVGNLKVLKTLANSGFSNVYLVEHSKTKVRYALKAIKNPNHKFRIQNEIDILKSINHSKSILKLQKVFYNQKKLFFLYDLANSGTLKSYVKRVQNFEEDNVLQSSNRYFLCLKIYMI